MSLIKNIHRRSFFKRFMAMGLGSITVGSVGAATDKSLSQSEILTPPVRVKAPARTVPYQKDTR